MRRVTRIIWGHSQALLERLGDGPWKRPRRMQGLTTLRWRLKR